MGKVEFWAKSSFLKSCRLVANTWVRTVKRWICQSHVSLQSAAVKVSSFQDVKEKKHHACSTRLPWMHFKKIKKERKFPGKVCQSVSQQKTRRLHSNIWAKPSLSVWIHDHNETLTPCWSSPPRLLCTTPRRSFNGALYAGDTCKDRAALNVEAWCYSFCMLGKDCRGQWEKKVPFFIGFIW